MVDIEKGIKAYSREGLAEFMKSAGMPAFRAKQIEQWLYQKGATSYDEMTNLSKDMRAKLTEAAPLYCAEIDDRQVSCDGTRKYIVRYADGCTAEMVAMPSAIALRYAFRRKSVARWRARSAPQVKRDSRAICSPERLSSKC